MNKKNALNISKPSLTKIIIADAIKMVISLVCFMSLLVLSTGCFNNTCHQRRKAVESFFATNETNQFVEIKSTTYGDQFIVRCEDGSIWEIKVDTIGYVPPVIYQNCLFDPTSKSISPIQ